MLQLLADNPYIVMDEHFEGNEDRTEEPEAGVDVKVWGNVVAFVERLDDEHFKSLQVRPDPSGFRFPGFQGSGFLRFRAMLLPIRAAGTLGRQSLVLKGGGRSLGNRHDVVAFVERLDDEHFKSLQVWPDPSGFKLCRL